MKTFRSCGFLGCILLLFAAACSGGGDDGGGGGGGTFVKHLYFSQDSNPRGLFELDVATGEPTLIGTTGVTSATTGLTETQDPAVLLGSTWNPLAWIATDGSASTPIPGSRGVEGLAMNIETGVVYGSINGSFYTLHPTTGVVTQTLAAPPGGADVEGLAADPIQNVVYGIAGSSDQNLYKYNPGTNAWSTVGSTGVSWNDAGLAFDHKSGILYAVDALNDSLYRINPSTAAATLIGPLGMNGAGGLAFVIE